MHGLRGAAGVAGGGAAAAASVLMAHVRVRGRFLPCGDVTPWPRVLGERCRFLLPRCRSVVLSGLRWLRWLLRC